MYVWLTQLNSSTPIHRLGKCSFYSVAQWIFTDKIGIHVLFEIVQKIEQKKNTREKKVEPNHKKIYMEAQMLLYNNVSTV